MGEGNVFTGVCYSVHRGGLAWKGGNLPWGGGGVHGGGHTSSSPRYGQPAVGTHPTGMHSC